MSGLDRPQTRSPGNFVFRSDLLVSHYAQCPEFMRVCLEQKAKAKGVTYVRVLVKGLGPGRLVSSFWSHQHLSYVKEGGSISSL